MGAEGIGMSNLRGRLDRLQKLTSRSQGAKYDFTTGSREALAQRLERMHDKLVGAYAEQGIDPPVVSAEQVDGIMQGVIERANATIRRYHLV
jgi:hypothetical protein